jgi:hypothetical protein
MESFYTQLDRLNSLLSSGVLPDELNFTKQDFKPEIDMSKLKYNSFYRSYEFVENKFPKGHESIPGFDKVIQSIVDKMEEENITPLNEIIKRSATEDNELPISDK